MNGITVLAEHFCRAVELNALIGNIILFSLLIVFTLIFYVFTFKKAKENNDKTLKNTALVCFGIAAVLYIAFVGFEIKQYNTTHMEYTITIDDSVRFNEFYDKYEVVSVDGEKYRVIER